MPKKTQSILREVVMPASASGSSATNVAGAAGSDASPITLLVDVQFSGDLSSLEQESELPDATAFERWAQQAFTCAERFGWNRPWRVRINSSQGEQPGMSAIENTELCIRLVDGAEGEALNATWRDKHSPTNVLSFEADIVAGQYAPLGDLVLCAPVILRESAEQGKSVAHHCAHLVVHGVLHLLGFDHQIDAEAEAMEAMEAAVLSELGVGNPYE